MLTLIQAQQRLIDRANQCHPGHRRRVIRGAARELHHYLKSIGTAGAGCDAFDQTLANQVVRDAIDMANLELNSED